MNNPEKSWPKKIKENISNLAKGLALGAMIVAPKEIDAQHNLSGNNHQKFPSPMAMNYNQNTMHNSNYGNTIPYPVNHNEQHHTVITQEIHAHKYHKGEFYQGVTFLPEDVAEALAHQLVNNPDHYHLSKDVHNYIVTKAQFNYPGKKEVAKYEVRLLNGHWVVGSLTSGIMPPGPMEHDVVFWDIPALDQK